MKVGIEWSEILVARFSAGNFRKLRWSRHLTECQAVFKTIGRGIQGLIPLMVSHCILGQGSLDRSDHTLFDGIFIVKTNFLLGRVNIDIHKSR